MTAEELSQTLRKLHDELSSNPELDENAIESLRTLLGEIQVAIARAEGDESQVVHNHPTLTSMGERLRLAIDEFEARHPRLTLSLSQIADRLTAMGI